MHSKLTLQDNFIRKNIKIKANFFIFMYFNSHKGEIFVSIQNAGIRSPILEQYVNSVYKGVAPQLKNACERACIKTEEDILDLKPKKTNKKKMLIAASLILLGSIIASKTINYAKCMRGTKDADVLNEIDSLIKDIPVIKDMANSMKNDFQNIKTSVCKKAEDIFSLFSKENEIENAGIIKTANNTIEEFTQDGATLIRKSTLNKDANGREILSIIEYQENKKQNIIEAVNGRVTHYIEGIESLADNKASCSKALLFAEDATEDSYYLSNVVYDKLPENVFEYIFNGASCKQKLVLSNNKIKELNSDVQFLNTIEASSKCAQFKDGMLSCIIHNKYGDSYGSELLFYKDEITSFAKDITASEDGSHVFGQSFIFNNNKWLELKINRWE